MIYITGDIHGDLRRLDDFAYRWKTSKEDTIIILGDVGFNYYGDIRDIGRKHCADRDIPLTFFCIHGNHEMRPQNFSDYIEKEFWGGKVLYEPDYPSLLFAIDGEIYNIGGKRCLVIGGAYSVDKEYRLRRGLGWFSDEQPSPETKALVEANLGLSEWSVDVVLSHTCPLKYEPVEAFLPLIDQSKVDKSTEEWLDSIEQRLTYDKWYCGHYHTEKIIDKLEFMYESIKEFK